MAVISVRLNTEEEKIISFLSDQMEKDKSTLIKYSIQELYEDFIDKKAIEDFEKSNKNNKIKFISSTEILDSLKWDRDF